MQAAANHQPTPAADTTTNVPTATRTKPATSTNKRARKPAAPLTVADPPSPASTNLGTVNRCWKTDKPASIQYHDEQWGHTGYFFPSSLDDTTSAQYGESLRRLFMLQSLELMQAGLSWSCIFNKWTGFERAFDSFDLHKVSQYDDSDVERLLNDDGIVRNKLKINAVIENARTILKLQSAAQHGFLMLLFQHHVLHATHHIRIHERILSTGRHQQSWMRTDYRTTGYKDRTESDGVHPSISVVELSKELKRAGFRFMGETVVLSWMQAVGLMNHHAHDCDSFERCEQQYEKVRWMFVNEALARRRQAEEREHQDGNEGHTDAAGTEEQAEVDVEEAKQTGRATQRVGSGAKRTVKRQKPQTAAKRADEDGGSGSELTAAAGQRVGQSRGRKRRALSEKRDDTTSDGDEALPVEESVGRGRRRNKVKATKSRA